MANVHCPECGHAFKAVDCRCLGYIVNAEAWKLGKWDWRWLTWCFRDGVRPSDIDAVVEKYGHFLVFETKGPNVPLKRGQSMMLDYLSRLPEFTVATIWGQPDEPERMQVIGGGPPIEADRTYVEDFARNWWLSINRRGIAKKRGD